MYTAIVCFDLVEFTTRVPDISDASVTRATRMRLECDTSDTSEIRVRHERHEYDTSKKC